MDICGYAYPWISTENMWIWIWMNNFIFTASPENDVTNWYEYVSTVKK